VGGSKGPEGPSPPGDTSPAQGTLRVESTGPGVLPVRTFPALAQGLSCGVTPGGLGERSLEREAGRRWPGSHIGGT
jgi:hypothetical protein